MHYVLALLLSLVVSVSGNQATVNVLSSDASDQSAVLVINDQAFDVTLASHISQTVTIDLPPLPCNTPTVYDLMVTVHISGTEVARTQAGGIRTVACPYRLYVP